MKTNFGVKSTLPANYKLSNGYNLYEWVMRKKCFPSFWGRPISGDNAIDLNELEFFQQKQCKVMLVFDDFNELDIASSDGTNSAIKAINAAIDLGIPQNDKYAIYVIVPSDWCINHNWMISFAETLSSHGYIPAFVGNTDSSDNFNFDRETSHYVQALSENNLFETVFGATEPKVNGSPETWTPYCPSAFKQSDIKLWICDEMSFNDIKIPCIYVRNMNTLDNMY